MATYSDLLQFLFLQLKYDQKQFWDESVYNSLYLLSYIKADNTGTQGRNLKARTGAEAMEKCSFMSFISWLAQFAFL